MDLHNMSNVDSWYSRRR